MGSKSSKTEKDREVTNETEGKLKTLQSSELLSNTTNLLKKLSFRNGKSISSETAPSKENEKKLTKTENVPIKISDVNDAKQFHLNDSFIEQISNLNINDGCTNLKKSTLQKNDSVTKIIRKSFDKRRLSFDKNIEVEESDIAPNNLRTAALCNTEVKIENNVKLVNTSYNSTSNCEYNQNKQDKKVIERGPEKPLTNIRINRIALSPLRREIFEADAAIENNIKNLRLKEYISEEIERAITKEISKSSSHGVDSNVLLFENNQETDEVQCNNFGSLYTVDNTYLYSFSNTEFIEANKVLERRKRVAATRPESLPSPESSSSKFQLNDLSGNNESVENFFYRIQTYIMNNCYQSDYLLPNSMHYSKLNQTAHEKSIASKDQQTSCYELMTKARRRLFNSRTFDKEKCMEVYLKMYSQVRAGEFGTTIKEVIHNLKLTAKKYRRTNLHAAVMEENLEKAFCIVEMHKQYHTDISTVINMRDNKGKTVLDRAEENRGSRANDLLIDYLKENYAEHSIHHMIPLSPTGTKSC